MPLNPGLHYGVLQRVFNFERIFDDRATYVGSAIPLPARATVFVHAAGISATLLDDTNWKERVLPHIPDEFQHYPNAPFRRSDYGKLLEPSHYGEIESKNWRAKHVLFANRRSLDAKEDAYTFNVGAIEQGDSSTEPAAVRILYRRAAIQAGRNEFSGRSMFAHAFTDDNLDIELQRMAILCDWAVTENEATAVRHAMSVVAGQSLQQVALEGYAPDGTLVWTRYQAFSNPGDRGKEFFHPRHEGLGKIAAGGWGVMTEGIYRLLESHFPIEMVLYHLHHASRQPYDIDAQHLVLAIHTAFEAWTREYGTPAWMSDDRWKKLRRILRAPMEALAEYASLSTEMKDNIRNKFGHAHHTEMGWRQKRFFTTLQISIDDADNKRALGHRNEILHNGYFLHRWRDLTQAKRQERVEDIERLRRLALLIVLKLAGYSGPFRNPVTHVAEHIDSSTLELPAAIVSPNQSADPAS